MSDKKILYCHCAYSLAIAKETKMEVLRKLSDSGVRFDAVPDLCKLSAEKSPLLQKFANENEINIIACYPRAVKWLFASAQADLKSATIHNMRETEPQQIINKVLEGTTS